MSSGRPKQWNTCWNRAPEGRELKERNLQLLEKRLTTTRMVVLPFNTGRSITKSTAMWDHGLSGVVGGINFRAGLDSFVAVQTEHDLTALFTSTEIPCHQYFWAMKVSIRASPRCPFVGSNEPILSPAPAVIVLGRVMLPHHLSDLRVQVPHDRFHY